MRCAGFNMVIPFAFAVCVTESPKQKKTLPCLRIFPIKRNRLNKFDSASGQ